MGLSDAGTSSTTRVFEKQAVNSEDRCNGPLRSARVTSKPETNC